MPIFLKIIPDGGELVYVIMYPAAGLLFYFAITSIFTICFYKIDETRGRDDNIINQNKRLFLKEQYLRKKYRYIKLDNKENIINSNIDIGDKILLLEIIHDCSSEEIAMLFKKNNS